MNISLRNGRLRIMAVNSKDFMIKVNSKNGISGERIGMENI